MTHNGSFLFVHIPRTAGKSISDAIGGTIDAHHNNIVNFCDELTEPYVRDRFVFTTVRNPWDRAVSWYLFFGLHGDPYELLPFAEWIVKRDPNNTAPGEHGLSFDQMGYCCNTKGEVLVDEFMRFESLDADFAPIAKRLGVSPEIKRHAGFEGVEAARRREALYDQFKLPRIDLTSIAKDYRSAYTTQESIDTVARLEKDVIDRFGYDFAK